MLQLPAYVGIILKKDDQVLLIKRKNTDWGQGQWNFPGGLLEEGETLIQAAAREAREEVDVNINPEDLRLMHVLQVRKSATNTKDIFGFYFVATIWQETPVNNEPERHSEIGWFSINELPEQSTQHAQQAIAGLKSGTIYSIN